MNKLLTIVGAFGTLLAGVLPLAAQDGGFTWENATEVGFVTTGGNTSSTTLSLKTSLEATGGPNTIKVDLGGLRASSSTRRAQGTASDFEVVEETVESAANYNARARYDRNFAQALAFTGAGWERNTFAGFENRFSVVGGMGRSWIRTDRGRFRTDIGGTFTMQEDVGAGGYDRFGGVRVTVEGTRTLTGTTELESTFVLDENLANTDDLRFDWESSVSVALTEGLALETSYQLLFDNVPALAEVPLFDASGTRQGTVDVRSSEVDSFLTLSLVIKL